MIRKILENKLVLNDNLYQKVLLKFMELFKKRNNLSYYISLKRIEDDIIFKNGQEIKIINDAIIKNKHNHYHIIFNIDQIKCSNIKTNLKTFFHETWHFIQNNELYSEKYHRNLFKMDLYIAKIKGEYVKNNYENLSYESDAFLNENILLYQYLANISKPIFEENKETVLANIRKYSTRRESLYRIDQFGNKISRNIYFDRLAKMYKINPYKDLGLTDTYNEQGRRLRPLEIFHKLEKLPQDEKEYQLKLIMNANYELNDLAEIIQEIKEEIEKTTGDYKLLIKIYFTYINKYLRAKKKELEEIEPPVLSLSRKLQFA